MSDDLYAPVSYGNNSSGFGGSSQGSRGGGATASKGSRGGAAGPTASSSTRGGDR